MPPSLLFYLWWMLENTATHYFIFDFLLRETGTGGRHMLPLWIGANAALTLFMLRFQIPFAFLWDILFLIFFSVYALKIRLPEFTAPVSALILLLTLKEGLSASLLSWSSRNVHSATGGLAEQIGISALIVFLFFLAQKMISERYSRALRQAAPSFLYFLTIPCLLFSFIIRFSMQLDSLALEASLNALNPRLHAALFFLLLTASAVFVLLLEAFRQIARLSEKEKQTAVLERQIAGQRLYLREARKRNAQYASFHHDIENHFLVLSGLLHEKHLPQAEAYLLGLRKQNAPLTIPISTGNMALDALLSEKLGYAEAWQIRVEHSIKIPTDFAIDNLDLCALFSNLFDNAITACQKQRTARFFSLRTVTRGRFLFIEETNPAAAATEIQEGTGFRNMRQIAEKYHGTVETERKDGIVRISVLLCSPETPVS